MKIKLVLLSIVSFFSLCINAESFSFLFSEGETQWRITIDTRTMTYTHHNLSTGYKAICNCKSICASKNDDGIIINLEPGPLVVSRDKIDWIYFFIDSKIGSLATYQKSHFCERWFQYYPDDIDDYRSEMRRIMKFLPTDGLYSPNYKQNKTNSTQQNNRVTQPRTSKQPQAQAKVKELPLKFDATIKIKKDDEDGYYTIKSNYREGEYVINVYTRTGKYIDDTDLTNYNVEVKYVVGNNWFTISHKDPRFILFNLDENYSGKSRIALLNFTVGGKKAGTITVVQLAKGAVMTW